MLLDRVQQVLRDAVSTAFGREIDDLTVDFPDKFGDVALNCFYLARELRLAPPAIAAKVAEAVSRSDIVQSAEAASGYVNLTLDRAALFAGALEPVLRAPETFGNADPDTRPRTMVEFSAPNTNKPQHLGHVRNNCLGDSVSRLLDASGHHVVRTNLINDRGIHICKSMLAYEKEGDGATPESTGRKGDHFVGDYYVRFDRRLTEEYEQFLAENPAEAGLSKDDFFKRSRWGNEAQQMLQLWEHGDDEVVALWRTMNEWVISGFHQTYDALGIAFDRVYLESETYKLGKEIIDRGLEAGVFYRRDDGAVEIDLTAAKLDRKVVLRSDGTSVYITQDIGTTVMKAEEYSIDGQIFVVGNEQIYHFKVLFTILERLGYAWARNLHHLAYGMVNLPEGKMKSREGTVVDADDLIDEVTKLARDEIVTREPDTAADEVEVRARKIGLAALKFMILSVSPATTMTFDPKESVAFDGDTGPYVLYAYARIRRMLEGANLAPDDRTFDPTRLSDPSEVRLALKILQFPQTVARAARDLNPAIVTGYLLQLARAYHSHNRQVPILKAEDETTRRARLMLSQATAATLRRGLGLLGIETVDRM